MNENRSQDPTYVRPAAATNATSPSRRRWLMAAAAGALSSVVAVLSAVRFGGYDKAGLAPSVRSRLQVLAPWQYLVVRAVAQRLVAPDRADDATIPNGDEMDLAGYFDRYLAGMRPLVRRDILRLVGLIEHVLPLSAGHLRRFTKLEPADQDDVLRSLESSRIDEPRAGFEGIKSIVMMGFYGDPRTWSILRYPGPLVDRPSGGFWP